MTAEGVGVALTIVDDEPLWLDLLRVALSADGMEVAATFADAESALTQWPPTTTVALLDIELGAGRMHGFELARRLRARHPALGIVFLTSVADPWMLDEAAASAIAGTSYLLKRGVSDLEHLRSAIHAAAAGELVIDEGILDAVRANGPVPGLTPVQGRILRLLAMGRSNAQIAQEVGISVKTVEANVTRIARTIGVEGVRNVRVACVTHYLAAAAPGPHDAVTR